MNMTSQEILKELKCLEVKENEDGSADIIFEATDKFKDLYLQAFNLSEWSQEHFEKFIKQAIDNFTQHINNNERVGT